MKPINSRRKFLRNTAAATVGLSLVGTTALATSKTSGQNTGYSSVSDFRTDYRSGLKLGKDYKIEGRVVDKNTLEPVANAKIELWFKDSNSLWSYKRGYFYTDVKGNYSCKTPLPGRKAGSSPRVHFRITDDQRENSGMLCLGRDYAFVHASHWENHRELGADTLPETTKAASRDIIRLNFTL
ncbi:hypothetical protein [Gilvibacter sp.]|uniref:hypothetical protein n=1 Tax=Gilvibacter sp. TaxID=2729997 RepID=UPI003F4A2573